MNYIHDSIKSFSTYLSSQFKVDSLPTFKSQGKRVSTISAIAIAAFAMLAVVFKYCFSRSNPLSLSLHKQFEQADSTTNRVYQFFKNLFSCCSKNNRETANDEAEEEVVQDDKERDPNIDF